MSATWAVVLVPTDHRLEPIRNPIRTFGPYASEHKAEQARRRIHFDAVRGVGSYQRFAHRMPHTYVTKLEEER